VGVDKDRHAFFFPRGQDARFCLRPTGSTPSLGSSNTSSVEHHQSLRQADSLQHPFRILPEAQVMRAFFEPDLRE